MNLEKAWQLTQCLGLETDGESGATDAQKTVFDWQVPDGWQQGRGAYGGLVIATMVQAVLMATRDPDRTVRSITAELCGPVMVGPARVVVEVLRNGSGMTTAAVRVVQAEVGKEGVSAPVVQSHAVIILGKRRVEGHAWNELRPLSVPSWQESQPQDRFVEQIPAFARQFEYRVVGPAPYSRHAEAVAAAWIRPVEAVSRADALWVVALSDVVWPSMITRFAVPRPMATISYMLEIVDDLDGVDPQVPVLHVGRTPVSQQGYTVEFRELWGADGRLLALNQQTIVMIR